MQSHSLHRHDAVQGFGCSPTSVLQRKWCLYRQTHCLQMQTLYIRLPCLQQLWSLSMRFPNLKNILRLRPSVFKFNLKWTVIFLLRKFSCLHPQQAGQAGTNSQFLNQILQIRIQKRLLGFSQTRHSAQNCADRASYPLKALWPTRGPVPSSPLSFCQSFHRLFLQLAESGVFSNLLLTQLDFCGSLFQQFNITYLLRVPARLLKEPEQVFDFLIAT